MIPERFSWHDPQWARIGTQRAQERLPHALLLRGPRGVGKHAFARRLAAGLVCASPVGEVFEPCGACTGCRLSEAGTHPDVLDVGVLEDKREIVVDQIRELIHEAELTARFGGYKPVIVRPAEALNRSASNTLLKTLEEPPGATVFVLVAESSSRLSATVRSRCQRLDFTVPDRAAGRAWLEARLGVEAPLDALLDAARGGPLEAASMHEDGVLEARAALTDDALALAAGRLAPLAASERWRAHGPAPVAGAMLAIAESLVRARLGVASAGAIDPAAAMQPRASGLDLPALFDLVDRLGQVRAAAERGHRLNEQLSLESLAVDWTDAMRGGGTRR